MIFQISYIGKMFKKFAIRKNMQYRICKIYETEYATLNVEDENMKYWALKAIQLHVFL